MYRIFIFTFAFLIVFLTFYLTIWRTFFANKTNATNTANSSQAKDKKTKEEIIKAFKLAQNQIAADRSMCNDDDAELWDIYQDAILKTQSLSNNDNNNANNNSQQ